MMKHIVTLLSIFLILTGAVPAQQPLFELLPAKQTGIEFRNDINESENLNVLAYEYFYNGGGVAVGDINNDGLLDIFLSSNMGENKLYLNLGNFKFKDITQEACPGLEGRKNGWKTGVTMADVNGDGLLDIYICYSGKVDSNTRRNQLFINQGNLKFKEEAKQYGLDDPGYSTQAVFFDYDNDGDLDMFLLNHNVKKIDNLEFSKYKNQVDELASDKLFENQGGHFVDVSKKAGIHQNPLTFGLGVAIADINMDGWEDIYVTNDYNEPDYVYINNHDGSFREESNSYFRHLSEFSMGVDIADFNNDGLPDIITLDMLPEDNRRQKLLQLQENYESFQLMIDQDLHRQYMRNMLQLNNGDGSFSEIAQLAGVSNTDWSWCPLFADFDNDGYKDLLITNGYLRDYTNKDFLRYWGDYKVKKAMDQEPVLLMDLVKSMPSTNLNNCVFRNNQNLGFSNMQKEWGFIQTKLSNGAVYADLDNDGDLDIVINNLNQEAFVYRNRSRDTKKSAYLAFQLKGLGKNTQAIGAKVFIYSKGQMQYQELNPNKGYLSCVSTVLNFGLGQWPLVDSARIIWPDQTTQLIQNPAMNQRLQITENPGLPLFNYSRPAPHALFTAVKPLIDYKHEEFTDNDFKRQLLMPFMYSKTGPVLAAGDINKDGLQDIFVSGDKNKPGRIYLQKPDHSFEAVNELGIGDENRSTISAACFFDANGDGFDDLYVAKGGYSLWEPGTATLQDEIFMNDGKGHLQADTSLIPDMSASSKSCVRACDYDGDGDMDLFVGGRIIPGQYPLTPKSYLLNNDGKGHFHIVPNTLSDLGMVTDACWVDLDHDGRKDLIVCGEMMPVKVFLNKPTGFVDKTSDFFDDPQTGFWSALCLADLDGDGEEDLVAGNLGLNSQIKVSEKEPAELYFADFDANGSIDPFLNFYIQGKSYPFVSRDELNEQIYPMRRKFSSYKAYADATMTDIVGAEALKKAGKLTATENRTTCFMRRNGKFVKVELPIQAQFSMVTKIIASDFNHDGKMDMLLLGNHSDNRLKLGSIDANYGCLLAGDGKGHFQYISQPNSGFSVRGDVKSALPVQVGNDKYLIIGVSNEGLFFYKEK